MWPFSKIKGESGNKKGFWSKVGSFFKTTLIIIGTLSTVLVVIFLYTVIKYPNYRERVLPTKSTNILTGNNKKKLFPRPEGDGVGLVAVEVDFNPERTIQKCSVESGKTNPVHLKATVWTKAKTGTTVFTCEKTRGEYEDLLDSQKIK